MPRHDSSMVGRLAEQLIMPETHRLVSQQLAGSHDEGRIPQDIVKALCNSPMPQRMEQHGIGVRGFVAVEFVKQVVLRMRRILDFVQLAVKLRYLLVTEYPDV